MLLVSRAVKYAFLAVCLFCIYVEMFAEEPPAFLFDRDGTGRLFIYGDEQTAVTGSAARTFVSATETRFTQSVYDEQFRLTEKNTWDVTSSSQPSLSVHREYQYFPDTGVVKSTSEIDYPGSRLYRSHYTEDGLVWREQVFSIDNERTNGGKSEQLLSQTDYVYNEDRLLVKKQEQSFPGDSAGSSRSFTTVYLEPGNTRGSCEYYENDRLQLTRIYYADGNYTETVFFPDGSSIAAVYAGGVLVEEIFYMDNTEIRRVAH